MEGLYAHKDIAFRVRHVGIPQFKLYLLKFQRLKRRSRPKLGWSAGNRNCQRSTTALTIPCHQAEPDTGGSHLAQAGVIYAEEADVLNITMFKDDRQDVALAESV